VHTGKVLIIRSMVIGRGSLTIKKMDNAELTGREDDGFYVFANSYFIAKDIARRHGVPEKNLRYVSNLDKLKGLRGIKLLVHSSAICRKDYYEIMNEAKTMNVDIVDA
jgi:hypothetical protein